MNKSLPKVVVYTDGSCIDHWGGWAASLYFNGEVLHIHGSAHDTTNNRMELTAVIEALKRLTTSCVVYLYSDSQYVLNSIVSWIKQWKRNNWMTQVGKPVQNRDLLETLDHLCDQHYVKCTWVKGHYGHIENEIVNDFAQLEARAIKQQYPYAHKKKKK